MHQVIPKPPRVKPVRTGESAKQKLPKYMQFWHGKYRIRRPIPKELQAKIGRGECLTESLGTADLAEAIRRSYAVLARFQGTIDEAANEGQRYTYTPWRYGHSSDHAVGSGVRIVKWNPDEVFAADLAERSSAELEPLPFPRLIERWAKVRDVHELTKYAWTKKIGKLTTFVGHEDVRKITPKNIVQWRDKLLDEGSTHKTVDNLLTVAKTLFNFAVADKLLAESPAKGINVTVREEPEKVRLAFTIGQAKLILERAREADDPVIRWCNWIGCFSGLRIEEIAGAMRADFQEVHGRMCLVISKRNRAEGASLKTAAARRVVPLHPAILAEGLLEYVAGLESDSALFPDLPLGSFAKRGAAASKRVNRWLDSVGIDDSQLVFHSWRHTWKDWAEADTGLNDTAIRYLMGHAAKDVHQEYGGMRGQISAEKLHKLAEGITRLSNPLAEPVL